MQNSKFKSLLWPLLLAYVIKIFNLNLNQPTLSLLEFRVRIRETQYRAPQRITTTSPKVQVFIVASPLYTYRVNKQRPNRKKGRGFSSSPSLGPYGRWCHGASRHHGWPSDGPQWSLGTERGTDRVWPSSCQPGSRPTPRARSRWDRWLWCSPAHRSRSRPPHVVCGTPGNPACGRWHHTPNRPCRTAYSQVSASGLSIS